MECGHVIIAGTGRSGTTLLVRLFARMGVDTGFSEVQLDKIDQTVAHAGLEFAISKTNIHTMPTVIKNPNLVDVLPAALSEGWLDIDIAIVPLRNLEDAAASRVSISKTAYENGENPNRARGGLWKTRRPVKQDKVLAAVFYKTVETLVQHNVRTVFLSFPRFALDVDYFIEIMGPYLKERFNISDTEIRNAHTYECKPKLIGTFKEKNN